MITGSYKNSVVYFKFLEGLCSIYKFQRDYHL